MVHDELADFTYSLGCIEMVYDPGLTHDHGVYVFGETSGLGSATCLQKKQGQRQVFWLKI
jgi:hypothetical protein